MSELVKLSEKELYTAEIIQKCVARELTNAQAAADLGLGIRQVQRLKRNFKRYGVKALASKKRGRHSNHQLPGATKTRTCDLLQQRYPDFGPTLAQEKLSEVHHLVLSRETVRQWMIAGGVRQPHRVKRMAVHPLRELSPS